MRARFAPSLAGAALAGAVVLAMATVALAGSGPGSPAQIAAGVAHSVSITQLPSNLSPSLSAASTDTAYVDTPSIRPCNTVGTTLKASSCVFGDTKGTKTMVLWGDSHAFMWFPAVNAAAKVAKWKLVALMEFGCPVADISVWNPLTKAPYTTCDTFRKNMISVINKLNPNLVILTESFTSQAANAGGAYNTISTAQWQAALERTLRSLHSRSMKKVILGSTIGSSNPGLAVPSICLSAYPKNVQKCTIADTAAQKAQRASEAAAAKATKVPDVNVLPWLCTSAATPACSQVIGDSSNGYRIAYYKTGHLTETYALFLTTVLGDALKPLMK
jgi:hypothetical protein